MALVDMKDVWKFYNLGETRIAALRGVSFSVEPGEFVAVWGPSGSGKTTLCNLIGMIDTPTKGSLWIAGEDITDMPDDETSALRNRFIGFIFQNFNLVPVLTALENVALPLQIRGESYKVARKKAMESLAEVGVADHAAHRPDKLSGGQRQRVAIARALITTPVLIIADEPTANLDTENAQKIIDLMLHINRIRGATFLFSTHDQRLLNTVQRQVHLHDGMITEDRCVRENKRIVRLKAGQV